MIQLLDFLGLPARRCHLCGKSLSRKEFAQGSALSLLGSHFCLPCLERCTLFCRVCRIPLVSSDFEEGRAVRLLGHRYCQNCLRIMAFTASQAAPPVDAKAAGLEIAGLDAREILQALYPPPKPAAESNSTTALMDTERRGFSRYIPPIHCKLFLRQAGLRGFLTRCPVHQWLDVSMGGFRVIIPAAAGRTFLFSGSIRHGITRERYGFTAMVRYTRDSRSLPGKCLASFAFRDASRELKAFLRTLCVSPTIPITSNVFPGPLKQRRP